MKDEALRASRSWPQTYKQMKGHSKSDRLVWNGERTRTWMKNDWNGERMRTWMKNDKTFLLWKSTWKWLICEKNEQKYDIWFPLTSKSNLVFGDRA